MDHTSSQANKGRATQTLGRTTMYQNVKVIDSNASDNILKDCLQDYDTNSETTDALAARDMIRDQDWTLRWSVCLVAVDAIKSMALVGHVGSV